MLQRTADNRNKPTNQSLKHSARHALVITRLLPAYKASSVNTERYTLIAKVKNTDDFESSA